MFLILILFFSIVITFRMTWAQLVERGGCSWSCSPISFPSSWSSFRSSESQLNWGKVRRQFKSDYEFRYNSI